MSELTNIEKIRWKEKNFTWICINYPDEKAMLYLKRHYKFHPLDLDDCLSEVQRPKIDDYENYLFIVLHIPITSGKKSRIEVSELDIFIGQNFIVTVHEDNPIISKIFSDCKKKKKIREEYLSNGAGYFLYRAIKDLFESCFPLIDDLTKHINELERDVFDEAYSRDRLQEILLLKKDIINFRRIIMPQRAIIAQLEHKNKKFLPENLDVYFDDVVDKTEKIWNNLENLQELTVSLQETNESIISHNTNNIIKILTLFSVIMLPLTFITGFYGMNLDKLPFAGHSEAVSIVSGIILLVVIIMIGFYRYKKWL